MQARDGRAEGAVADVRLPDVRLPGVRGGVRGGVHRAPHVREQTDPGGAEHGERGAHPEDEAAGPAGGVQPLQLAHRLAELLQQNARSLRREQRPG